MRTVHVPVTWTEDDTMVRWDELVPAMEATLTNEELSRFFNHHEVPEDVRVELTW